MVFPGLLLPALVAACCHIDTPCVGVFKNDLLFIECRNITDFTPVFEVLTITHKPVVALKIRESPQLQLQREFFAGPGFQELVRINYIQSALSSFSPEALGGLQKLDQLILSDNKMTSVDAKMFTGLEHIEELDLSHNLIDNIVATPFHQMKKLASLNLRHNRLTSINPLWFHGLNLQNLHLGSNSLTAIEERTFTGLATLHELELRNNKIKTIHPGAFQTLEKLKMLDLGYNQLQSLDSKLFTGIELMYFRLSGNDLENIANFPINIPSLRKLSLDNCKLQTLPVDYWKNTVELLWLELSENKISNIEPDSFQGLQHMYILDLEYNSLTSLSVSSVRQFLPLLLGTPRRVDISAMTLEEGDVRMQESRLLISNNPWDCSTSEMRAVKTWSGQQGVDFAKVFYCSAGQEDKN